MLTTSPGEPVNLDRRCIVETKIINLWSSTKHNVLELNPVKRAASGCAAANDIIAYTVTASIDMSKLSPAARFIAERISTTLRCGKNVRCFSKKTEVELMRAAGRSEDYIQRITYAYGPLQQPYMDYDFGIYRHDITPEQFLNAAADHIAQRSTHMRIGNDTYTF